MTSTNRISDFFSVLSFDHYNQLITGQDNKYNLVTNSSGLTFTFSLNDNIPRLVGLAATSLEILMRSVRKKLNYRFEKNIFYKDYQIKKENLNNFENQLEVSFELRDCTTGEYFDFEELNCMPCQAGLYSFEKNFLEFSLCKSCVFENFNCYGGFNLTPKRNFWRKTEESTNFLRCPSKTGKIIFLIYIRVF